MSKETRAHSGVPVMGILGTFLVILKLGGVIDTSWWWVLAPFWVPFLITIGFLYGLSTAAKVIKHGKE